ncbi:MAG: DNA-formamidopyrimidine glycosylase family protein [Dehalococcoidia bacterium]
MPEIPDLEGYATYFNKRLPRLAVVEAEAPIAWIVRVGREEFLERMKGQVFKPVYRHAKLLMFPFDSGDYLVVHAMLAGRYQYVEPAHKRRSMTCWILHLDNGMDLRYSDERRMGRAFLVRPEEFAEHIPRWSEMGADIMSPHLNEDGFLARMMTGRGMIKNIITSERTIAGIGNAYSDEVLWEAGIHPFRKRTDIPEDELRKLFRSIRDVMNWASPIVTETMEEKGLPLKMYRDHLRVHAKGGEDCPRCGHKITAITSGGRETNFCRQCQK